MMNTIQHNNQLVSYQPQFSGSWVPFKKKKKADTAPTKNPSNKPSFEPGFESSFYTKREQFLDGVNDKVKKPFYTVFGKWLKVPGIKQKAQRFEFAEQIDDLQNQLESILTEKNWTKKAGLRSPFWQAYHLPENLNLTPKETVSYIEDHYLPLIEACNSPKDFRLAQWTLEGLAQQDADKDTIINITNRFTDLIDSGSPYLQVTETVTRWFQNRLADAFFNMNSLSHPPLTPPTQADQHAAYRFEQGQFTEKVLAPFLLSSPVADNSTPTVIKNYLAQVLPETLNAYSKNYPAVKLVMTNESKNISGFRPDFDKTNLMVAELLHHSLVLNADLTATPLESTLDNSIQHLKQATKESPKNTNSGSNQTDLVLTHDDLDAHITETLLAYDA